MALLEVRGLVKYYGRRKVVDGVNFTVDAGEVVGLLGPNGAGKTTSFRMTTGQISPDDGQVWFNGHDVTALPMFKRARLGMGYLAQETSVFRKLTVEQNILAILEAMPVCRSLGRKLTREERQQRTDAVLEQFGLSRLRKNNAARLSGGERRRLEIARCLVCEPLLILLDEPFTGIDPITIADIRQIVRDLRRQGIGILLTDHNVREALKITDRSYLIKDGKVRTHGTPHQIIHDPIAIAEYLGTGFNDLTLPGAPTPAAASPPPVPQAEEAVSLVLEQEKMRRLVERLTEADGAAAAAELANHGPVAIPALLDALDRRDVELRRLAFQVLQGIVKGQAVFDPYAPEAQRRQQLAELRDRFLRKAG
ncbi:MAG: LPS export ABC transporter ATP-binding protein [Gemmataceae bacterium]|nr:LPS export ABC transporter ATP-binding protein [Gemmataceae bacterium]MDW8264427.1 LPS export ABC transporter ATP-binding protein [Gemmataceae bacterium]